jgi:hypothetical protein
LVKNTNKGKLYWTFVGYRFNIGLDTSCKLTPAKEKH